MADDEVVYPLLAVGLAPKDDDDIHEDVDPLFGINIGSDSAPICLDDRDAGTIQKHPHRWHFICW